MLATLSSAGFVKSAGGSVSQLDLIAADQATRHEVRGTLASRRDVVTLGAPLAAIRHEKDFAARQSGCLANPQDRASCRLRGHGRQEERKH